MKKPEAIESGEIRAEYDFSSGKKNPYAARFALGSNIVMIRPDIFAAFPSEKAVNEALERLLRSGMTTSTGRSVSKQEEAV